MYVQCGSGKYPYSTSKSTGLASRTIHCSSGWMASGATSRKSLNSEKHMPSGNKLSGSSGVALPSSQSRMYCSSASEIRRACASTSLRSAKHGNGPGLGSIARIIPLQPPKANNTNSSTATTTPTANQRGRIDLAIIRSKAKSQAMRPVSKKYCPSRPYESARGDYLAHTLLYVFTECTFISNQQARPFCHSATELASVLGRSAF